MLDPEPQPKTYELPSARQVVAAGFQLAVASTAAVRRGSIYIGLLALAAFGPVVLLVLVALGRLLSDPDIAVTIASDPTLLLYEHPELASWLIPVWFLFVAASILLIAISIDAQAIAIATLGGVAAERPLRLPEAITRARQTFWRLAGAGFLVGVVQAIVSLIVTLPFVRLSDPNTGLQFIGSMLGALVVTPWAFAGTSIVLGDVGAVEGLRRSAQLFRARPRIAFVVVLFTLVTAAIQTFALSAGLDLAVRFAEFFHLGLDQGGIGLVLPVLVILAFVVAFGSLTFTIAAIVAAPQVAGFLGLTFYSGGLDRARAREGERFGPFHWVSVPMTIVIVVLVLVAAVSMPSIASLEPRASSPALSFLRTAAESHQEFLFPYGSPITREDPSGDHGGAAPALDLVVVDYAYVPVVPDWLLDETFACAQPHVACGGVTLPGAFVDGGYLFVLRTANGGGLPTSCTCTWAVVVAQVGRSRAPSVSGIPYPTATDAFLAALTDGEPSVTRSRYANGSFASTGTRSRSAWVDGDVVMLIPGDELGAQVINWDAQASTAGTAGGLADRLGSDADPMIPFPPPPDIIMQGGFPPE